MADLPDICTLVRQRVHTPYSQWGSRQRGCVRLTIAHEDGRSERKLFTATPLGDGNHIKCIFKRIQDFGAQCLKCVRERFGKTEFIFGAIGIFEPSFDATAVEVNNSVVILSEFHRVQADTLAPGIRRLMGIKTALQQDNLDLKLGKNRDILMAQVLTCAVELMHCHPSEMHMKIGIRYMLFQAQSAQLESVLSKRAHVKRVLQNAEVELINTYAIVSQTFQLDFVLLKLRDLISKFAKCDRHRSKPHGVWVHSAATRARLENVCTPDAVHFRNVQLVTKTLTHHAESIYFVDK